VKVGVLALQGAFREHREVLDALGLDAVEVRTPEQLSGIDALFLPGGESTTITKLLHSSGLVEPLRAALAVGLPVFGTRKPLLKSHSNSAGFDPAFAHLLTEASATRQPFGRAGSRHGRHPQDR